MKINYIELREKKGLTIADVVKKSGLNQSVIWRLENKHTVPNIDTVTKYLNALDLELKIVKKK